MESWTYINHDNINRVKYNEALGRNVNQNSLYAQDFVWDALHPGWDILISGDYKLVVPIPFKRKWGITSYRQPLFMRTIPLIGEFDTTSIQQLCAVLEANSLMIHLNFPKIIEFESEENGVYQVLTLLDDIESQRASYSTNTKRQLKRKQNDLVFDSEINPNEFISFFKRHVGFKYGKLTNGSYERLKNFIVMALERDLGTFTGVKKNEEFIAMAFFIDFNGVRYYIKGAAGEVARVEGAMFHLIDYGIAKAISKGLKTFDFVGSNAKGVSGFNKKFGAEDEVYGILKSSSLIWPINKLIKP